MSFALTKSQLLDGSKTVTRRLGWERLRPGERLRAVSQCMGLRKGQRAEVYGVLEVLDVRREPLEAITAEDVRREGFDFGHPTPEAEREAFIMLFCQHMRCYRHTLVTRIAFRFTRMQTSAGGPA